MLRRDFFTKEIRRLLHGGVVAVRKHSQSPVLPWARLAYDACLNAGSTAFLADNPPIKLEPPPGMDFPSPASQVPRRDVRFAKCNAPNRLPYQRSASLEMLWGLEKWRP